MTTDLTDTLVVAVSSRALFDLEAEDQMFRRSGLDAFARRQRDHEGDRLMPGPAFPLVRALLSLNARGTSGEPPLVEVVVVSSQHPDTSLRVFRSIAYHGLGITRAGFTGGANTLPYLEAFGADLLLSRSEKDVQAAVDAGIAAAEMYDLPKCWEALCDGIRIAFDGDAVLFSDDSEAISRNEGLEAFQENEARFAHVPMPFGPMGGLLKGLARINAKVPGGVRTALVTARSAPAHERALRTLRAWGLCVDEAFFLGGLPKSAFLKAFAPAIFFDDNAVHLAPASVYVPSGRVPYRSDGPLFSGSTPLWPGAAC